MSSDDTALNAVPDSLDHELPPSPPTPDALDSDTKASRKREREVSIEPATSKEATEVAPSENKDRRTPATKKNRLQLDSTEEEPDTPPSSPKKIGSAEVLSTSPPHETKVRQIRERVRGLNWDDTSPPINESQQMNGTPDEHEGSLMGDRPSSIDAATSQTDVENILSEPLTPDVQSTEQTNTDSFAVRPAPQESDSDDQEKKLKRKLGDRAVSSGAGDLPTSATLESTKRARDDAERDDNPREKKRPTPPPEELQDVPSCATPAEEPKLAAPQPKTGGFLSYASTSSPFAATKGPSMFGNRLSPSPSSFMSANTSGNGNTTSHPLSPFATSSSNSPSSKEAPTTGIKRTGFEAFAATKSPFATASRSKSPTGFSPRSTGLNRSKSPPRVSRALGAINAFSSYSGSTSPFTAPPVKKQRQDQESGSEAGDGEKDNPPRRKATVLRNGGSTEGSEDESDRQTSFGERLRAGKSEEEDGAPASDDDEARIAVVEQDLHTGEENEETLFQVRGKLYQLSPQNQWQERGTGLLKLNVRKSDGGGARLVMRKEAVYTLLLNATLFKGMKCSLAQDPRYVRFSSITGGSASHYNLRLANAKVAGELLEEINANIPGDEPDGGV